MPIHTKEVSQRGHNELTSTVWYILLWNRSGGAATKACLIKNQTNHHRNIMVALHNPQL